MLGIETHHVTSAKHPDTSMDSDRDEEFVFHRTRLAPSPLDRLPGIDQLRVVLSLRARLEELVQTIKPDVIHAHSPCLNGLAALHVARRHSIPLVYELRASWEDAAVSHGTTREGSLRYRLSKALETFVLRRADAIVTICEGLRTDVVSRGVDADRVTVVGNAVDRDLLVEPPADEAVPPALQPLAGRKVIGFFGSFYSYEGLDLLVSAVARLKTTHPDVVLLLLGSGPEDASLRAQVERLGIGGEVTFLGRVPHQQVAAFYRHIEVFVFPRRRMRLTEIVTPLKPLEAMAAGALVVASDVGGHRELIEGGATGILFPADDVEALVVELKRALDLPHRYGEMRQAGRRYVHTQRTWPQVAKGYLPVYESLVPRG
jgi:PEP-CTERM/exosortase A-associated glycosyltransferase